MSMSAEPEPQVIDLREFFAVLRRRKWSIILVTLLVTGLAIGLVYRRTPVYTSQAQVQVKPLTAGADLQSFYYDPLSSMDTEAGTVTSYPVAKLAAPRMGLDPDSPTDIGDATEGVSVSVPANTIFLDISCTRDAPEDALICADAFAQAYIDDRVDGAKASYDAATADLYKQISDAQALIDEELAKPLPSQDTIRSLRDTQAQARLQLVATPAPSSTAAVLTQPADLPAIPSNKDYISTGILAMILGLALGIGLAFVRERMDEHIAGRESLEDALDAPVLAVVPQVSGWRNKKETRLITLSAPDSPVAEAYKTARTTLLYLARKDGIKVFAITGPGQGEGKTTTTVNLAVSLAQAGHTVVAVSCDLRKPRLHRFFKLGNEVGLSTVLQGVAPVDAVTKHTDVQGLRVIASGPVPDNPAELLGSRAMEGTLEDLRARYDFVLLDTPPALVVSDAIALAPRSDGVLVVVDASRTTRAAATALRHQFDRVGGRILGGVLNNLDPKRAKRYPAYYRSYYSSNYREEPPATGRETRSERRDRRSTDKAAQDLPPIPPMQPGDTWP